jgi:hypothetical protein
MKTPKTECEFLKFCRVWASIRICHSCGSGHPTFVKKCDYHNALVGHLEKATGKSFYTLDLKHNKSKYY